MKGNKVNPLAEYIDLVNRMAVCLRDVTADLEAEIVARYPEDIREQYPSEMRKYRNDMYSVWVAQEILKEYYSKPI